jgi:hypothetical protein
MGFKNLNIAFENDQRSFWAGTILKGKVKLQVDSEMSAKAITLKMIGQCRTVVVIHRGGRYGGTERFTESTNFFTHELTLWCPSTDGELLQQGDVQLPFEIKLPETLPSSFKHQPFNESSAVIDYNAEAKVNHDSSLFRKYPTAYYPFAVYNAIDCNLEANLKWKHAMHTENVGCASLPLTIKASIPRVAYSMSDNIVVDVELGTRNAPIRLKAIELRLLKRMRIAAQSKAKVVEIVAMKFRTPASIHLLPTQTEKLQVALPLKKRMSPNIENFDRLNVYYAIQIRAIPLFQCTQPCVEIPVIMGTIPLRGTQVKAPVPSKQPETSATAQVSTWDPSSFPPPLYD